MNGWAIRTIKNGAVRINGKTFRPRADNGPPYDGRLDGQRWAFGLYKTHPDLACLWGTETMFRAETKEEIEAECARQPNVFEYEGQKGVMHWMWWEVEGE